MLLSPSGHSLVGTEPCALPAGLQQELVLLLAGTCSAWPSPAHSRLFLSSSIPRSEGTAGCCRMLPRCGDPPACLWVGGLQSRAGPSWVLAGFPVAVPSCARPSSQHLDGASLAAWQLSAGHPLLAVGFPEEHPCAQLRCQSRDS